MIPGALRRSPMTLTVAPGSQLKYSEIMREARIIKLNEIGIKYVRCRRSMTGGMIIEIPGKDNEEKAEILANKLKGVFNNREEIRPIKIVEMRICDLEDSITIQEVEKAIALKRDYNRGNKAMGRCFSCRERGHLAKECKNPPKCPLCSDLGCSADHRLGSRNCNPPKEKMTQENDRPGREKETEKEMEVWETRMDSQTGARPIEGTLNHLTTATSEVLSNLCNQEEMGIAD